jgi:hypothetical protein
MADGMARCGGAGEGLKAMEVLEMVGDNPRRRVVVSHLPKPGGGEVEIFTSELDLTGNGNWHRPRHFSIKSNAEAQAWLDAADA